MLGDRLKKLRKGKGVEAQFIAKKLNVSKSTYSGYENNKSMPNYDILKKLADIFDCTTDFLLGRTDSEELAVIENDELPQELKDIGVEYLEVNEELKEKGFTPEKIRILIKTIEDLNLK
jgi:transcriptional regulator with XRE-family HTH domain